MPLTYTTVDAISRRLQGRLHINTNTPTLGGQSVSPELIKQVGEQVEGYINLHLGQVYELPLQNRHEVLADVAESLVISKLLEVHFQGGSFAQPASDVGGAAMDLRRNGERMLQLLLPQERRTDPTISPQAEPLVLPGEIFRVKPLDATTRNVTVVAEQNLGGPATRINWGGLEDFQPRARGAEPLWNGRRKW